jgi:hypothetical protein
MSLGMLTDANACREPAANQIFMPYALEVREERKEFNEPPVVRAAPTDKK